MKFELSIDQMRNIIFTPYITIKGNMGFVISITNYNQVIKKIYGDIKTIYSLYNSLIQLYYTPYDDNENRIVWLHATNEYKSGRIIIATNYETETTDLIIQTCSDYCFYPTDYNTIIIPLNGDQTDELYNLLEKIICRQKEIFRGVSLEYEEKRINGRNLL